MEKMKCRHIMITLVLILVIHTRFSKGVASYSAVYVFGASYSETGNCLISDPSVGEKVGHLPYGETFFHKATGRYSDGRLVIDYLADYLGMPFLPPSFGKSSMEGGLSFAVAGATGLPPSFFKTRNVTVPIIYSLDHQIDFFLSAKEEFCTSYSQGKIALVPNADCDVHFERALYFMGEMGMNDYHYATQQHYTFEELETFVGPLADTIATSVERLIKFGGARNILIQNIPPAGCLPDFLSESKNDEKRDEMGCLLVTNEFLKRSNEALEKMFMHLNRSFPHASLVLLDYYNATMSLLLNRRKYGMRDDTLEACCGVGGPPYNVNQSLSCGLPGTIACQNPNEYFSWDGTHFTDAANGILAHLMLENIIIHGASS